MLTSVNSPSSLLQVVSNGDDDELEFRSYVDDAWYSVRVAFDGRAGGKLIVRYCNFPDDNDSVYEAGKFYTFDELDDFASRFRPVSVQLQDSECRDVVADGLLVCASHAFTDNDVLFYDAVVEQSSKVNIVLSQSIGTTMFASQRKLQYVNCGKGDELKVVRSGTEDYKTAKGLRDLLVEFTGHQERLHKSLAFKERKILKSSSEL